MSDALSNAPEGVDASVDAFPSADRAEAQKEHGSWPKPGEEGFVHPDGTPQSVLQLAQNAQAAADRDAAGSSVHGAPAHGVPAEQVGLPNPEATAAVGMADDDEVGRHNADGVAATPASSSSPTITPASTATAAPDAAVQSTPESTDSASSSATGSSTSTGPSSS